MKIATLLLLSCLISLTGACASSTSTEASKRTTYPDPAEAQIAEAATSVSRSLSSLAEIQQATTPPPENYTPPDPATYGMANLTSVDWSGPVEPLLKQISKSTGYKLRVLGTPPAVPVMVFVSKKDVPIGTVLRDIGFQSSKKADIVVYPNSRIIELRYARYSETL